MGPARTVPLTVRHRIAVYDLDDKLVWQKHLTDEDVAALTPAIASTGGPDLASGCWLLEAFIEPYVSDE